MCSMSIVQLIFSMVIVVWRVHGIDESSFEDTLEKCKPSQVHISYGRLTTEMVIMWSTAGQCSTAVKYGVDPWKLDQLASGESLMFNDNTVGLKVLHRVELRLLMPNKTYFYTPVSDEISGATNFFRTPASNGTPDVQLMIISDVNTTSTAIHRLLLEAQTGKYAALLHTGNIAMNLSTHGGLNGDNYMKLMEPAICSVPYMVSPGPAEVEEQETFSQYLHRFSMPETEWPISVDKMWYSVDIGPVHLISYSTEVFYTKDGRYASMQHDWLIKDLKLANLNRKNTPWVVAFGHKPLYCTYEDPELFCNKKISKVKSGLEDIFYHYGVDIIIQSYGGAYERTFPMYKGVQVSDNYTDPLGPVHIICGGASQFNIDYNFTEPAPAWSAFRLSNDTMLTYGRLNIVNGSILDYEQVNIKDGSIVDSLRIVQGNHGQFSTASLPPNVSAEIDKEIVDAGGKPGILNIEEINVTTPKSKIAELLEGDNRNRIIIGASCGGFFLLVIIAVVATKKCRRKSKVARRWEQMDINYGKKFYSKAPDKDEDNDFEIDMSDGTEPTRKLLNAAD
ncbi:unnamed protein product [Lymnaea stagnalis]|uniref:Purple acid phosphatase n=1 Tax=Lymnaea stagnalis TaxID=6523 RepID=A0AAV2I3C3_LYMST